jgi:hypothetical protein
MADLLTLSELSKQAKISLQTLLRYKKLYPDRIPSVGTGRKQRYPPHAAEAVQALKRENVRSRGPRKGGRSLHRRSVSQPQTYGDLARRLEAFQQTQIKLAAKVRDLIERLGRPLAVTLSR